MKNSANYTNRDKLEIIGGVVFDAVVATASISLPFIMLALA